MTKLIAKMAAVDKLGELVNKLAEVMEVTGKLAAVEEMAVR